MQPHPTRRNLRIRSRISRFRENELPSDRRALATSDSLSESAPANSDSVDGDLPTDQSVPASEEQERVLPEQSKEAFQLVERFPDDQNAVYLLGLIHQEQGDIDAAMQRWQQCQQLNAAWPDLYDSFGQGYVLR